MRAFNGLADQGSRGAGLKLGFIRHLTELRLNRKGLLRLLVGAILLGPLSALARSPHVSTNPGTPATLHSRTVEAFAKYVGLTETRNNEELRHSSNTLWVDSLPESDRTKAYQSLADGEVQIGRRETLDAGKKIACPGGLIHHWEAVVFIPRANVDDVLRILQDYNRHSVYYAPDVERSKLESRDGDYFRFFLRFRRKKVITVVMNSEHDVRYFRDSATQAHSRSTAFRIAEVENPGKPDEREKSHDDDGGFLWGMETWWRIVAKDGGVYVQSEVVSLTRDIPAGLGWMIGSFVNSIPKETLSFTMQATRNAVLRRQA